MYLDQVYSNTRVPTQINTSLTRVQHESTQVRHESARINTSQHESTRVNTNQHDSNTSQYEAARVQNRSRPEKQTNMVKRKDKAWLNGVVEDCIYQDLGFF